MTDGAETERRDTAGSDEPLARLAAEAESRRHSGGTAGEFDDVFTETTVEDTDDLWADLEAEDSGDLVVSAPREESEDDRDVRTIPKATCHGCPHFGDPPTVHCLHEGTNIITMVDTEQFRVADCPMVVDEDTTLTR
ncbi:hypothetical protein [Haladaptatus caseinilyticus]|uniref:hypothetical protein n=1 Tax=Haladaptatus caseinilyticus TaxID=2993314 RepID=UPI00224B0A31|nr:hypothetical protein [Haladaptatus caseinilyticus]